MKKYSIGLFAIAIALILASFKTKAVDPQLWIFDETIQSGDPTSVSDAQDQTNYRPFTAQDDDCSGSVSSVCVIEAEEDGTLDMPKITGEQIYTDIANALGGASPSSVHKRAF